MSEDMKLREFIATTLFSPPIGTIATWNWKHDLYLFGNGEIGNPVSYVDRKQIENNPKWVRI